MQRWSSVPIFRVASSCLALILAQNLLLTPFLWAAGPSPTPADEVILAPGQLDEMLKEVPIPKKPTAPPQLFERTAPDTFRCQRFYVYQGRTLGCDSNLGPDGERLRPILSTVPGASAELDQYQRQQRRLRATAYAGSAGLVLLLAGILGGGGTGKKIMYLSGGSIFLGSIALGLAAIHTNESKLGDAVDTYNRARPNDPIQLQFNTGIGF
ncbi:MAG: hypothetical protein P4M08_08155 [Oligoflexia bacterium]|nr:hypothetical protein [Oligoflexia bacterium]